MKKLKLFLLMFAAAVASVGFTACSDDDDEATTSIVGTWIYQDTLEIDIITFGADGTFVEQYQDLEYNESDTVYGIYSYDGHTLILNLEDGETEFITAIVSGDSLILDNEVVFTRM